MLGMIIGTSSVIAVLGISKGAQNGIGSTISSFGDPGYSVAVDQQQDNPGAAQIQYRDAQAVAEATSGLTTGVYPDYQRNFKIRAGAKSYDTFVNTQNDRTLAARAAKFGRVLRPEDVAAGAHVVVLSEPLADRFFPSGDAVGQEVRIGGYRFAVVGVYDKLKSALLSNAGGDDYVDVPYTAYHQLAPGPVDDLAYFAPPGRGPEATAAVLTALQHLHGPRAKYQTQDAAAQIGGFNKVLGIIGAGLSSIGGVALLVAGIGIMNIMLVSVTERTREIGIRKAIGASFRDVMLQFLLEAVLLSLMGGLIGMVLGLLIILAAYGPVSSYVGPAPIPYAFIVSLAMIFSLLVGSVFGTYPAYRAAKLDPIEALRS